MPGIKRFAILYKTRTKKAKYQLKGVQLTKLIANYNAVIQFIEQPIRSISTIEKLANLSIKVKIK